MYSIWGWLRSYKVGVCNEGRCSFIAYGLSNDGTWVFNKACTGRGATRWSISR